MATAKIVLDDIGENFLLCAICLEHFKEPKLLPCLHRFCSKCLDDYTLKHCDDLNCPVCQKEFSVPEGGFKTDFCVKNITEYVKLKQSLGTEKIRQCSGCLKELKVTAFCLKCHGFLCSSCHVFHETNTVVKDHRQHLIILDNFESSSLTMERLVSLKKVHECTIHPEKASELCCKSCDNQPICMACGTFGKHKGHDLYELTSLAEEERAKLVKKISTLNELKEKVYKMPGAVAEMKDKLDANTTSKKDELSSTFEERQQKMKERVKAISENFDIEKNKLDDLSQMKICVLKSNLEKEINLLNEKYNKACDEEKRERDDLLQMLQLKMEREKAVLEKNLTIAQETFDKLLADCKTEQEESQKRIQETADHFEKVTERFENVQSTASSVLAAKHDWADMQCIPDICEAIDELIEDINKDIPVTITDVAVENLPLSFIGMKVVSEMADTTVVANLGEDEADIDDITGCDDGGIVVSGEYRHITNTIHISVLGADGKKLRQMVTKSARRFRYCCFLNGSKVATVSRPDEIGIFDTNDGSYFNINIHDITQYWSVDHEISCVATDFANNMLVGFSGSRELYFFDGKLKYHHKLTLPEKIKNPCGLAVHEGNLLVCDENRKVAMAVSMTKPQKMIYQFKKPDVDGDECSPRRVCTGSLGHVYILWESPNTIAQYCIGGHLQTSRSLSKDTVRSITTVHMDGIEKLLVATQKKIMMYNLGDG